MPEQTNIDPAKIVPYLRAAKAAGCPADQMMNFLKAGVILHPKQLVASAAARECDHLDGPRAVGFGGSRGPGKSFWTAAQIGADDCQRVPGLKCLILRKVGKANKENFEDLRRKIFQYLPHNYKEREGVLVFANGSRIIIGHFKDESEIDNYLGLEYDVIGIEEATTLSVRKQTDIESCNRTSKGNFRPRMYNNTNPGGISHAYFKKKFIIPFRAGKQTSTRFVPALAKDNPSLNVEYERDVLSQYTGWQKRAWAEGDWDIEAGQYFTMFHYETHVIPRQGFSLPTSWDVWCSLDHGLTHYTTVYLLTKDGDGNIYCLDEHAERGWLPSQHADAIKSMLGRWEIPFVNLKAFAAGADCFAKKAHDEEIGTLADDYRKEGIILTRANIDRINGAKELYRRLGNPFPDAVSSDVKIRPTIFILDSCPMLIECIPSLQRDPKRPEDVLKVDCDADTGEGGDDCFVAGTPILTNYGETPIETIRPGDMVLTRAGYFPVVDIWISHCEARVFELRFDDGRAFTGTANHPVWVVGKGFTRIADVKPGDEALSSWQNPHDESTSWSSTALSFGGIWTRSGGIWPFTTGPAVTTARVGSPLSTSRSTSITRAKYPKDSTSTTRTRTRSTTTPTTSSCSRRPTMSAGTSSLRSDWLKAKRTLNESGLWPRPGMLPRLGERGTARTARRLGRLALNWISSASNAAKSSLRSISARLGFAPTNARPNIDENPESTTRPGSVLPAARISEPIGSSPSGRAPARVVTVLEVSPAKTFAVHVADQHEYYASGVLVKNCYDGFRYGYMEEAATSRNNTSGPSIAGPRRDFAAYKPR